MESERNDANEPQTEATAYAVNEEGSARDEREIYGTEQARSRGCRGDRWRVEWSKARIGHGRAGLVRNCFGMRGTSSLPVWISLYGISTSLLIFEDVGKRAL